jgi:dGTPase
LKKQQRHVIPNKSEGDIGFERHPLAYLVEAADICYTIIDFEDGINLISLRRFCFGILD